MKFVQCSSCMYVSKSTKNEGPLLRLGKSGKYFDRFIESEVFSNSDFITGIRNEY